MVSIPEIVLEDLEETDVSFSTLPNISPEWQTVQQDYCMDGITS